MAQEKRTYSTPLPRKLGLAEGHRFLLVGAPPGFERTLSPLPADVDRRPGPDDPLDVVLLFAPDEAHLRADLPGLAARLAPAGGLWVAWPKKASGMPTDLDFATVQRAGLDLGLVDNKICAVDETWSGLRFVIRKEDRPGREGARAGDRRA